MIIIVMGVSGAGKTTIGRALSEKINGEFIDADDHHPSANKEKMRNGIALNDADREPWLSVLNGELRKRMRAEVNSKPLVTVLACSALKEAYRKQLVAHIPERNIFWVYLKGSVGTISKRMKNRPHAYMPVALLESQFATLEEPSDALVVDVAESVAVIVNRIVDALHLEVG